MSVAVKTHLEPAINSLMTTQEYKSLFSEVIAGNVALDVSYDFAFSITGFHFIPDSVRYVWTKVKCRICQYEFMTIYPDNIFDETILECEDCGHPCCEPVSNDVVVLDFSDG